MTCGLPVIASKVDGIPELIKDNTEALLFESGSKDDLKEKLNRLIQHKQLQKMLAKNAKQKITTHYGNWKNQAEKLLALYEQLLASSSYSLLQTQTWRVLWRLQFKIEALLEKGWEVHYIAIEPFSYAHPNLKPHILPTSMSTMILYYFGFIFLLSSPVF